MPESLEIRFPNATGQELAGRLELPSGEPRAFALFAHCFTCSKDSAAARRIARTLAERGFGVLRFDFTGLGGSEGDFANTDFWSNVEDLVAAASHLRETRSAPALLVGHSFGGAAVLLAARRIPEVRAVVTIAAPSEPAHLARLLRDDAETIRREGRARVEIGGREFWIGRGFLEDLEQERPLEGLEELEAALLVAHSPQDRAVGIDHARRIFEAARHSKSFLSLDGADHLLARAEDAEYAAGVIAAWSARYLPARADERDGGLDAELEPREVLVVERHGGYANDVRAGRHRLVADEPEPHGGDLGPDPYAYLLASLGACTSMTLRMYAQRKGWPLEGVRVRLRHARVHAEDCERCEDEDERVDRIEREVEVAGALDDAQRDRLAEIADRCPIHRTLLNEKRIVTRVTPIGERG